MFCDASQLRYNTDRSVHCLKHGVAENCVELRVTKWYPRSVGGAPGQITDPQRSGITAGREEVAPSEIYSDDPTFRYRLSQPHCDSSLTTAAIEDSHIGSNIPEKKRGIDICAARFDCGLCILACECVFHPQARRSSRTAVVIARVAVTSRHRSGRRLRPRRSVAEGISPKRGRRPLVCWRQLIRRPPMK